MAEDNDLNAEIAATMLEMQGVKVERVVNGQQAVDRFKETLPGTYDLILMDLQMPIKDGLEAAVEIRSTGESGCTGNTDYCYDCQYNAGRSGESIVGRHELFYSQAF
ncbi:MAG: response regulator [Acidaminococcaceae bacterium]|nr:response regulator [Acidaminococcaceae bacterium]